MIPLRQRVEWALSRHPAYERLPCFDKARYCEEFIAQEQEQKVLGHELFRTLLEEYQRWRLECVARDPVWDIERHCYIKPEVVGLDDTDGTMLIRPRQFQRKLLRILVEKDAAGEPAQIIIVKSRKLGFTTIVACYFYVKARTFPGRDVLILVHTGKDAAEIFERVYKTLAHEDPIIQGKPTRSNEGILEFPGRGSRITVLGAAGRSTLGSGRTLHYFHASEIFKFPRRNDGALMTAVTNAMARPPAPTASILEGTAQGQDGVGYELANRAYHEPESSRWQLFNAWWFQDPSSHERKVVGDEARAKFESSLSEKEKIQREKYGLTIDQINYYRWTFENKIIVSGKGSYTESERRRVMSQEHPSCFTEAFSSSGETTFDNERISELLETAEPASEENVGELEAAGIWDAEGLRWRHDTPKPRFVKKANGRLEIWRRPRPGHRYAIGLDFAKGEQRGNFTAAMVLDRDTREFVAMFRARCRIGEMQPVGRFLCRYYNDAFYCPESNALGGAFIEEIAKTDVSRYMYISRVPRYSVGEEQQPKFGWNTTPYNKGMIVGVLDSCLANEPQLFTVPRLLEEMLTFRTVHNEETGNTRYVGATRRSETDDVVVAAALALFCAQDMPLPGERPPTDEEEEAEPKVASIRDRLARMRREQASRPNRDRYREAMR